MKKFDVVLTKSYKIRINTDEIIKAKQLCEFFTSDIVDISTKQDKVNYNFEIENITCKMNESYEVVEINEIN